MYLQMMVENSQLFFLVFARIFAMIMTAPLLSSVSVNGTVKVGISMLGTAVVFPQLVEGLYVIPQDGLVYVVMLLGEVLLGIISGFFLTLIFSVFQQAGQFFSVQMGFSASQAYDPLSEITIPIMGQFFNNIAIFVFISISGFQRIYWIGVYQSINNVRAYQIMLSQEYLMGIIIGIMTQLFEQALIIAFPVMGTLFLVTVTQGLLAKASPQMNLMMIGFPISISVAFIVLILAMPFLVDSFVEIIENGFSGLQDILSHFSKAVAS